MSRFFSLTGTKRKSPLFLAGFFILLCLASSPALALDSVPHSITTSFDAFAQSWMLRLAEVNRHNSRTQRREQAANGRMVGRYLCYGPDCVKEIRSTGSKATPYVGILRYPQRTMEKDGEALEIATNEIKVTEIFRYTNGRWVH